GRREIDATGLLLFPGLIDAHVHMALPVAGTRSSDDFLSGTQAAACGGVTTIVDFTVGAPERSIPHAIEARLAEAASSVVDYALHGEVVGWRSGRQSEFRDAIELGVSSFKFYTTYAESGRRTEPREMVAAFRELAGLGALALVHAEDEGLIRSIAARLTDEERGRMRTLAAARPDLAEQAAVSQATGAARTSGCSVHIVHVSSQIGLDAVRSARSDGVSVTAETCPQYLLLTSSVYDREDGHLFSASPPLRTDRDRDALWAAIRSRDIDYLATDHCPFTRAQKMWRGSFLDLPYGLPGVETLLPLVYTEGVTRGRLHLTDLARILSESPAKRLGIHPRKGALDVGSDADIVLYDPNGESRVSAQMLHSRTDFSPYEGRTVSGRVAATLSRGEVVYEKGRITASPGRGRPVRTEVHRSSR
ncbi:MAG: amidohydrolase family protein, partial [Candidatus Bipolaricaulis sp.]|nr:amidohydrolase family protein [Candidatus Bipolaricaulis sp.]